MNSDQLRRQFLEYFESREHRVVPSSPVVPESDPTLLFTNAGMNQFKDALLGDEVRDYKRAASVQKCIRAGGKHNDLNDVGKDGRHLTFFEMLGNWSFGDYYKKESIEWAWDFCLNTLNIDVARLYVTVHKDDDEARQIWENDIGVPKDRVLGLDEDNFWSMGPVGPCGPCSEIHYDLHPERGEVVFEEGYDDERVVEFWNLVFMEFNANADGTMQPLPMKSVDTGMGLDRATTILSGADSVFKTDLFRPIFSKTASLRGEEISDWEAFYNDEHFTDYAVIADHVRMVTFSLCDGAKFSNEGRGSVVRSVLRRAVRHGRNLGFVEPFLFECASAVIESLQDVYPELKANGAKAQGLIRLEEERFLKTIERGMELFNEAAARVAKQGGKEIGGEDVFVLHATFGFPPDLTLVMAEEQNLTIDLDGYNTRWAEHQQTSKGKDVYADVAGVGDWTALIDGATHFVDVSRDATEPVETQIVRYRPKGEQFELILTTSPFYAESGGQIGDTGYLSNDNVTLRVTDTQKSPNGSLHTVEIESGTIDNFSETLFAVIDEDRRRAVESNHTATHMLHSALRHLISDEIFQSGSLVAEEKLRFDFSYPQPVTDAQIAEMEARVNRQIREAHAVTIHEDVDRDRAVDEMGAMAIFGEKYGDKVRVVEIKDAESVELCGGTHVKNTRDIGLFRITNESGVAAGIRRIEAITNEAALASFATESATLKEAAAKLKTEPHMILQRIETLLAERTELERQVDSMSQKLASADSSKLTENAVDIDGVSVIAERITVTNRDQLITYADKLRDQLGEGAVLLATELDGKPALLCLVTDSAHKNRNLKAPDLVNVAAAHVGGRGGGRPTLAQAGGSDVAGLAAAVESFETAVRDMLSGG